MNNTEAILIEKQVLPNLLEENRIEEITNTIKIINGWNMLWRLFHIRFSLLKIIIGIYPNPRHWIRALKYLVQLRKRFLGNYRLQKMVYANGKYYMGLYTPGWNSPVYESFIVSQLNDFKKVNAKVNRFNTVFIAVTKKCAMQCDHCYEWETLNKKDTLTTEKLKKTVLRLQDYGVSQIHFSGGEPLLKMDTLVEVLTHSNQSTDFWIATSGHKLNNDNAYRLKKAGLTGVIISLDHFIPEKHNDFRGYKDAYYWVKEAVKNANSNHLVVALSICVTKEFISEANLMAYMDLAKKLGVGFVQFLEPKAVGHYKYKDVDLNKEQIEILETFFLKLNFDKAFKTFPIITYHGYYQRRQGCFSAGIKGMYVDTDGDINACPFCHKKNGNVLDKAFESHLETMTSQGCPTY